MSLQVDFYGMETPRQGGRRIPSGEDGYQTISARTTRSALTSFSYHHIKKAPPQDVFSETSKNHEIQAQNRGVALKRCKPSALFIDVHAPVNLRSRCLTVNKILPKKFSVVHLTDEMGKEILPAVKRSRTMSSEKALEKTEYVKAKRSKPDTILVVGHRQNILEKRLYETAAKALLQSQDEQLHPYIRNRIGLHRMERGTYRIRSLSTKQISLLQGFLSEHPEKDLPFSVIAIISRYLWGRSSKSVAVFKPDDEVRGGKNGPDQDVRMAKDGIHPTSEIPNEVIVAGLRRPHVPMTMQVRLSSDNFYVRGDEGGMVDKEGMLQSFVPSARNLEKIDSGGG